MQQGISNDLVPCEGPRAVPLNLDFTLFDSYVLDYASMQDRGFLSMVQALYIDNSANTAALTVLIGGSLQTIKAAPGSQGYYSVLAPNPIKMTFTSVGGGAVYVALVNTQMATDKWNPAGAGAAAGSGGTLLPNLVANRTVTGSTAATTAALITGAPGYYIAGFSLQLSSDATFAAADLQVTVTDSVTGAVAVMDFNAAMRGGVLDLFWNNKTALSTLVLTLSTPLTAGLLYYTIQYGLCSFVG